ncbi:MAG: GDP-mannose 4,6-dehydratase [Pseudomonadota bacterium]
MSDAALVTGITGQDGAYLASQLLAEGRKVYGAYRRTSAGSFWRLEHLRVLDHPQLTLVDMDITDLSGCVRVLNDVRPNEVYNLAAQSFVGLSFDQPIMTSEITGMGVVNLLEAIRLTGIDTRFYQASTSEMFGKVQQVPQNENTAFYPRSPYGVAKLFGHAMTVNYREAYGMFTCSGILFNHESPIRGPEFVTRKITDAVAGIKLGNQSMLSVGNLDAKRDWGFAAEYVEGMRQMLQHHTPDTFVLATGQTSTVRAFIDTAFESVDIRLEWQGEGVNEHALDCASGKKLVTVDPDLFRPAEVDLLVGDASKANQELGWTPRTSMQALCAMMVAADLDRQTKP